ncbi:MAG: aminoacyl-tRNA hydrolase [Clostridia bacterium]|nr:aminoacyl-tRNA hydrolase [Clostridia bacterium]
MASIFELLKAIGQSNAEKTESGKSPEFLLVGLGNPGTKYENTRHNAGFRFLDDLAKKQGVSVTRSRFQSLCGDMVFGEKRVLLIKPQTFMNLSGQAVAEAARFYKIPPEKVIVVSDDTSLDIGRLRVRRKGSDGGHNGLKNIILLLGTDAFPRLRIGVGQKPHPDYDMADWVLGNLNSEELKKITSTYDAASQGLEKILNGDVDGAMQICNGVK